MEKSFSKIKKALLIGIGGGADIVGTIPTKILLESYGIKSILGGIPWERYSIDPYPGPRPFSQIINKTKINDSLCWADKKTRTYDGLYFSESKVSNILNEKVILVNIFNSPKLIADDIFLFTQKNKIDLVVGIDVGGDILATGKEPGLASPLADSILLSALNRLSMKVETFIGVLGYGSDGELKPEEIDKSLSIISRHGGLLTSSGINKKSYSIMKRIIKKVETDASRIPLLAFEGVRGVENIRRGKVQIEIHPMSQITFYLDTKKLFKYISLSSRLVSKSNNILDANSILLKNGFRTELNYEIKIHNNSSS